MKRRAVLACVVALLSFATAVFAQTSPAAAVVGDWSGTLDAGAIKLRVILHVTRADDGTLAARFESVDQGGAMLPTDSINVDGREVSFAIARASISFKGVLADDNQKISGTFTQGPGQLALVLSRGTASIALNRPQEPKPPFPYRSEEVTFPGGADAVTLAGTLTLPAGAGPFPAVLLISGSGPQDRDEALMGHRPFLVLADRLTRAGIAVLRVDDRGAGKSTGNFATATTLDFASDAESGVRFLKGRPEVAQARIGLVGHSEGGLIAPIVASRSADVAFVVLLAGPGVTGQQILLHQQAKLSRAAGLSDAVIASRRKMFETAYDALKDGDRDPDTRARVEKAFADGGMSQEERQVALAQMGAPWFKTFLTLDPAVYLRQLKVPVLALNGSLDLQVDPAQNLPPMRAALATAGNTDTDVAEMPGLNHLFQHATTGMPTEYGTIEETMSPEVLTRVTTWITKHASGR
ncbi:MAG: alpha/beta fold hydrolase [Acidobacteriota bacterium]